MYIAYECWEITEDIVCEAISLFTNQEEADTPIFLHIKHAKEKAYEDVLIVSEDTDVFVLAANASVELPNINIYQKRGTKREVDY